MTDMELINYCDKHCKTPKALFAAWRVNRMIDLAGCPNGYEKLLDNAFATMRGEMQVLVDLARKRMARPNGGFHVEVGKAYRGVNGDVRYVIDIHPRFQHTAVTWDSQPRTANYFEQSRTDRPNGTMPLRDFKEWALEEFAYERTI
ncbi:MAG TPA: hypothetical protein VEC35_01135 [Noviherbaspirillum sp.]|nr:hypothetical protein [Noviherbaspirillum sp.]